MVVGAVVVVGAAAVVVGAVVVAAGADDAAGAVMTKTAIGVLVKALLTKAALAMDSVRPELTMPEEPPPWEWLARSHSEAHALLRCC